MGKPILCLDFDGVIHSYGSGWKGADVIPDAPVDGAMGFLVGALDHFDVQIFSSRSHQAGGREAMRTYLLEHLTAHMVASSAESNEHTCRVAANAVLEMIGFPTVKPPAMVSIDDRALTFTGEWPAIETLKAFKPWNKR